MKQIQFSHESQGWTWAHPVLRVLGPEQEVGGGSRSGPPAPPSPIPEGAQSPGNRPLKGMAMRLAQPGASCTASRPPSGRGPPVRGTGGGWRRRPSSWPPGVTWPGDQGSLITGAPLWEVYRAAYGTEETKYGGPRTIQAHCAYTCLSVIGLP